MSYLDYLLKRMEEAGEPISPELLGSILKSEEAIHILLILEEERVMTLKDLSQEFEDKEGFALGLAILRRLGLVEQRGELVELTERGLALVKGLKEIVSSKRSKRSAYLV